MNVRRLVAIAFIVACLASAAAAGSLDLPVKGHGLSIGNSTEFRGLRLNWQDRDLRRIEGITFSVWTHEEHPTGRISGLSIGLGGTAAYNRIDEVHGLQIGIFNRADELHGVQIGLLNWAGNNPQGLQLTPGINVHF